jgi:hypothetical protein
MSELIFLVEEAPEGGYTARTLGVGIFTEKATLCHFKETDLPKLVKLSCKGT